MSRQPVPPTRVFTTNALHEAVYQDFCGVLRKYKDQLTAAEILAVTANLVGKIIAMQDQRRMTPDMALALVSKNIEEGNAQALAGLDNPLGTG